MPEQLTAVIGDASQVVPVVVISQTFPARPSRIPEIREFVLRCLASSPLTEDVPEVGETVFRALLDAAGPTSAVKVSFRISPDHVEVDVAHANDLGERPTAAPPAAWAEPGNWTTPARPATFAAWMRQTLRREGLTQEAAARQLGDSVKTVGRWVGGQTEPRMRDLRRRIREVFGGTPLP